MEVASTEGERAYGDRPSGGKDVCRKGWAGADDSEMTEAFRRLWGGALTSNVDDRLLFGSCAGVGLGGEMAVGELTRGGEAMVTAM